MRRYLAMLVVLLSFSIVACSSQEPLRELPDELVVQSGQSLHSLTAYYCGPVETWSNVSMWRRWLEPKENNYLHEPGREYVNPIWGTVVRIYPAEKLTVPSNLCGARGAGFWWTMLTFVLIVGGVVVYTVWTRPTHEFYGGP